MKTSKNISSIFIITAIFTIILALFALVFAAAERFFPSASMSLKNDLLFIGLEKELTPYTPSKSCTAYSLTELIADKRTECNNSLVIISQKNPIGDDLDFSSVTEYKNSGVLFDTCAHDGYQKLSSYIQERFGKKLYVMSAYRDEKEQSDLYAEQGSDTAQRPGESEHQSGLALDVYVSGFAGASFLKTDVGKYVNSFCHQYGFIIRYPDGAKDITGIDFEPWHIRYVGAPHADIISLNSITLEEYTSSLSLSEYYSYGNYIICKVSPTDTVLAPESYESLVISPDNCGNYILTIFLGNN